MLKLIQEAPEGEIRLRPSEIEFAADSLFCEWAYVIDLDKNTFEVYRGFNHGPVPEGERFADMKPLKREHAESQYYPIRHLISFPLDKLPTKRDFLRACNRARKALDKAAEAA